MNKTIPFLNGCISFVAFITALALVVYMLVAFITGMFDVSLLMFDTVFLEPAERQSIFNAINSDFLHNIAVLIVLMKSYRILVEYMRFRHIDMKFMLEIGIIACILELLFNSAGYTEQMQMILAGLALGLVTVYSFKYETFVKSKKDSRTEFEKDKLR
jgi:uncharacterized membrane protein (DUF373 family)